MWTQGPGWVIHGKLVIYVCSVESPVPSPSPASPSLLDSPPPLQIIPKKNDGFAPPRYIIPHPPEGLQSDQGGLG